MFAIRSKNLRNNLDTEGSWEPSKALPGTQRNSTMDISPYLQRIKYEGSIRPEPATLRALQLAHLTSVPFENLDIHLARPITLDLPYLFNKIISHRRGGFCYELNGLFAWLLRELGYHVTLLSASDAKSDGSFGPEFDHLALLVQCPAEMDISHWLVDVGWGDSFTDMGAFRWMIRS